MRSFVLQNHTRQVPPGSVDSVEFLVKPEDQIVLYRSVSRDTLFLYPLQQPVSDQGKIKERLEGKWGGSGVSVRRLAGWQFDRFCVGLRSIVHGQSTHVLRDRWSMSGQPGESDAQFVACEKCGKQHVVSSRSR